MSLRFLLPLVGGLMLVGCSCQDGPGDDTDDTADTGDTDTDSGDTDSGDTDSGDTDSGDTDSGDTDSGDTADTDTADTGGGDSADSGWSELADDLPLLDVFAEGSRLDANWRWASGEIERREIVSGGLILESRAVDAEGPVGALDNHLRTPLGVRIDQIAAKVTVEDFESIDAEARVWLALAYQPVADRATSKNFTAVRVAVQSVSSQELQLGGGVFRCLDETCSQTAGAPLVGYAWNVGVDHGVPLDLEVRYDEATNTFVVSADGFTGVADASLLPGFDPDDFLYAELRTQARNVGPGDEARIRARFDDVFVDDALYDAFSGSRIDLTKWQRGEYVREIHDGALRIALGHQGSPVIAGLPLRVRRPVDAIAAEVTVEAYAKGTGEAPSARVGGAFYYDGTVGDGAGEQNGMVHAYTGMTATKAFWVVARCTNRSCTTVDVLGQGDLADVALGETHTLYVAYDGTAFTFQVDDGQPASFAPANAGSTSQGPAAATSFRGVENRYPIGASGGAYVRAHFDDVRASGAPWVSFTRAGGATTTSRTTADATADDPRGLATIVAFGPDGDTEALLIAKTGPNASVFEDCGAGCGGLAITLPYNASSPWIDDQVVNVTADFVDPATGTLLEGTGTLTFDEVDPSGVDPSTGTFSLTFDDEAVEGSFEAAFLPRVEPRPTRGTHPDDPVTLNNGCVNSMFCDFSAPTGRDTWFRFAAAADTTYAVRGYGGDATITVADADGTTACSHTATPTAEFTCRATSDGPMGIAVEGLGGNSTRVIVPVSTDFVEIVPDDDPMDVTVPPNSTAWFRVRHDGTDAFRVVARPLDQEHAGQSVYSSQGYFRYGNGWCCTGEGSVLEAFVPYDGSDQFWVGVGAQGVEHDLELQVATSGDGWAPTDTVLHEVPLQYNSLSYEWGADEALYVEFVAPRSGAYEIWLDGMNWTQIRSPIEWELFTNPFAPAASIVPTSGGDVCPAVLEDDGAWRARCWAVLEEGRTYIARIEETEGVAEVLAAFGTFTPWEEQQPLVPDERVTGTLSAQQSIRFAMLADPDAGYRLEYAVTSAYGNGGYAAHNLTGFDNHFGNGFCCGVSVQSWRVPGHAVAPVLRGSVDNWDPTAGLSYAYEVVATGSGTTADDPFEVSSYFLPLRDELDGQEEVFYEITPEGPTTTLVVRSVEWGGVDRSPVDWIAFTDPSDPDGSAFVTCTAQAVVTHETTWDATCDVPGSEPFLVRARERDGYDEIQIEVRIVVN